MATERTCGLVSRLLLSVARQLVPGSTEDFFRLFTCTMHSRHRSLKKWIQVAVFTHDLDCDLHHQEIRIYFLNKTPCALQWAIQNEATYNFSLACPDTTFLFMEAGEDMVIHLSYLSEGWENVAQGVDQSMRTVLFEQIWHGACPHTFMCFRRLSKPKQPAAMTPEASLPSHNLAISSHHENDTFGDSYVMDMESEVTSSSPKECSEINIALRLNQERCENLRVPLNILAHNIKVKVCDTKVKVIDEGMSW